MKLFANVNENSAVSRHSYAQVAVSVEVQHAKVLISLRHGTHSTVRSRVVATDQADQFTLSEQRGKVVMLQFTAGWCGVCRKEMPHIESDIWQPNKDNKDFVLVGIDREEALEDILPFIQEVGTTYPIAMDTNADVFAQYALRESGITRNVLIDCDGRIVMLTRLFKEDEFAALVAKINAMLAE